MTATAAGTIHGHVAAWLVTQGYATRRQGLIWDYLDLTDAGSAALYPAGGQR